MIVLPVITIVTLGFVFQTNTQQFQVQLIKINCPYPTLNYNISNVNLSGATITYNQTFDNDPTTLKVFKCGENGASTVAVSSYEFTSNWFGLGEQVFWTAVQSNMAMWSSSMSAFFDKVVALGTLVQLFVNAPAQISALAWWGYVNLILLGFIAIGGFMAVRGS